jgi:hypothetical protein
MSPHPVKKRLAVAGQLAASSMRVFARWIEDALNGRFNALMTPIHANCNFGRL